MQDIDFSGLNFFVRQQTLRSKPIDTKNPRVEVPDENDIRSV